jgi:hypothetical protein
VRGLFTQHYNASRHSFRCSFSDLTAHKLTAILSVAYTLISTSLYLSCFTTTMTLIDFVSLFIIPLHCALFTALEDLAARSVHSHYHYDDDTVLN